MATATLEDTLDKLNSSLDRIANVLSGSNKKNQETRKEMVSRFKGTFQDDPITRLAKAIESNQSILPTKLSGTNVEGEKEGSSFLTKLLGGLILASGIGIAIKEFLQTEAGQQLKKELGTYFDEIIKPVLRNVSTTVSTIALNAGKKMILGIGSGLNSITDSISKSIVKGITSGFDATKNYLDNLFASLTPGLSNLSSEEETDIQSDLATASTAAAGARVLSTLNRANPKLAGSQPYNRPSSGVMSSKSAFLGSSSQNKNKPIQSKGNTETDNTKSKKSGSILQKATKFLKGVVRGGVAGIAQAGYQLLSYSANVEDLEKNYNRIVNSKVVQNLPDDEKKATIEALEAARNHQENVIGMEAGVGVVSTIASLVGGFFTTPVGGVAIGAGTSIAGNALIDAFDKAESLEDIENRLSNINSDDTSSINPDENINPQNLSAVNQESRQIAALTENAGGGSGGGNVNKTDITKIDNTSQIMASKFRPVDREKSFDNFLATYG